MLRKIMLAALVVTFAGGAAFAQESCRLHVPELVAANGRALACPVDPFAP